MGKRRLKRKREMRRELRKQGISRGKERRQASRRGARDQDFREDIKSGMSLDEAKAAANARKDASREEKLARENAIVDKTYGVLDDQTATPEGYKAPGMQGVKSAGQDVNDLRRAVGGTTADIQKKQQLAAIDSAAARAGGQIDASMASRGLYNSGASGAAHWQQMRDATLPAKADVEQWASDAKLEQTRDFMNLGQDMRVQGGQFNQANAVNTRQSNVENANWLREGVMNARADKLMRSGIGAQSVADRQAAGNAWKDRWASLGGAAVDASAQLGGAAIGAA